MHNSDKLIIISTDLEFFAFLIHLLSEIALEIELLLLVINEVILLQKRSILAKHHFGTAL